MFAYYHQLDPFLIQFTENFGIRWYSLAYIAGAFLTWPVGIYLIKKGRIHLPPERLWDIVFYGVIGAVAGGRLGYCLFYSPDLLWSFDRALPFWGLLKIHQGGMASHGGIAGLLISQFLLARRLKVSLFSLMDLGAVAGSIGIFFGRIANFINGELYGRVIEGKAWLAVRFPSELDLWSAQPELFKRQLLSLKSALGPLDSVFSSPVKIPSPVVWESWVKRSADGNAFYSDQVAYICHLITQHAAPLRESLEPLLSLRHPSQLYQALGGGLMTFVIIALMWIKPRKAGLISLVWIGAYLSFRLLTEVFRQPDPQIGFQIGDLTRGQILSLCLFLVALIYGYFVYKSQPKGFGRGGLAPLA